MTAKPPAEHLAAFERIARRIGVDIVSSAAICPEHRDQFHPELRAVAGSLGYALIIGVALSASVLDTVTRAPTWSYYHHYRTVNLALDQAALQCAGELRRMGFAAFPVPASQILDWQRLRGHLSHRAVGELAGLGWRGRNNLLVTPRFGSMARYATILTDCPLPARGSTEPLEGCGSCRACVAACPVGAIHEGPGDFELDRCAAQLRRFSDSERLNVLICGLCVRACRGVASRERDGAAGTRGA